MNASSSSRTNPGSEPARSSSRSRNAGQCSRTRARARPISPPRRLGRRSAQSRPDRTRVLADPRCRRVGRSHARLPRAGRPGPRRLHPPDLCLVLHRRSRRDPHLRNSARLVTCALLDAALRVSAGRRGLDDQPSLPGSVVRGPRLPSSTEFHTSSRTRRRSGHAGWPGAAGRPSSVPAGPMTGTSTRWR